MAEKSNIKVIGKCRFCGSDLVANSHGWGCSNYAGGCKGFIWKDDHFFQKLIGRKPNAKEAERLLTGKEVHINNVVIKGKKRNIVLLWGKKEDGPYPFGYTMHFEEAF